MPEVHSFSILYSLRRTVGAGADGRPFHYLPTLFQRSISDYEIVSFCSGRILIDNMKIFLNLTIWWCFSCFSFLSSSLILIYVVLFFLFACRKGIRQSNWIVYKGNRIAANECNLLCKPKSGPFATWKFRIGIGRWDIGCQIRSIVS